MNTTFKKYEISWAVLLGLFNVIFFVVPAGVNIVKFSGAYWTGYISVTISFVIQLICTYIAFKETKIEKFFYKTPLIVTSYIGLVLSIVVGLVSGFFPGIPSFVSIIGCALIIGFEIISIMKASASAEIIESVEVKIANKTAFIKTMTMEAGLLINNAKTDENRQLCKNVYDAFRYSDPMSLEVLDSIELQILNKFEEFKESVKSDDGEKIKIHAAGIIKLIKNRNELCKINK